MSTNGNSVAHTDTDKEPEEENQSVTESEIVKSSNWIRKEVVRKSGKSVGHTDVYYYPYEGAKRLRSMKEIKDYCKKENVEFRKEDFSFKPEEQTSLSTTSGDDSSESETDVMPTINFMQNKKKGGTRKPQCHLTMIEPKTYKEAIECPEVKDWKEAMDDEISNLKSRGVYEEISRPQNVHVLGNRWIYKLKKDAEGKCTQFRARLVAQGYKQRDGIDYDEVFAPVVNFAVIRLMFVLLVVLQGWCHAHLDVKCAFLYGELNEQIFMEIPLGSRNESNTNSVWILKKALYGLHQASRMWYEKLDSVIEGLGFSKMIGFNCTYVYKSKIVILVYVDDIIVFAKSEKCKLKCIQMLNDCFTITNLSDMKCILGVQFQERNGKFVMHQKPFIMKLAEKYGIVKNTLVKVPVNVGTLVHLPTSNDQLETEFPYRSLIGSLLFVATRTRPDILFSVILMSQYNESHTLMHVKILFQILQYLVNTHDLCINLSVGANTDLIAYSDASWAIDRDERKSFHGFIISLGNVPISWGCKKQSSVALSTMESEYVGIVKCVQELNWLRSVYRNELFKDFYCKPLV